MFLNIIKSFFIENRIKKRLNISPVVNDKQIETIGVLVDISEKNHLNALNIELKLQGVDLTNTKILLFKNHLNKDETYKFDIISYKDFSITGQIKNDKASQFVNYPFDLLICYFEDHQQALNDLGMQSKAKFKVGFRGLSNNYNNMFIETKFDQVHIFISETFKYLKILKKR